MERETETDERSQSWVTESDRERDTYRVREMAHTGSSTGSNLVLTAF